MSTWEYTTTVITHGFMGRQSDELDREKFQEELSRLGAEGWDSRRSSSASTSTARRTVT